MLRLLPKSILLPMTEKPTMDGILCACGAELNSVHRTVKQRGYIMRQRRCTVCGTLETTVERKFRDPSPGTAATRSAVERDRITQLKEILTEWEQDPFLAEQPK